MSNTNHNREIFLTKLNFSPFSNLSDLSDLNPSTSLQDKLILTDFNLPAVLGGLISTIFTQLLHYVYTMFTPRLHNFYTLIIRISVDSHFIRRLASHIRIIRIIISLWVNIFPFLLSL
jgi:hypothetical protein